MAVNIIVSPSEVGGKEWIQILKDNDAFRYEGNKLSYTARKEKTNRGAASHWYAYKRVKGKLYKRYLGGSADLNLEVLEEMGRRLKNPEEDVATKPKEMKKKIEELEAELREVKKSDLVQ